METELLYHWAKFQTLKDTDKRQLMNTLAKERLDMSCEARIYRVLTRLTFQTLRQKNGEQFAFTQDEIHLTAILKELALSPSTCNHWYYSTFKKQPILPSTSECASCSFRNACEHNVPKEVMERIKCKYEYRLVTKRLQQILVKIELFKEDLPKEWTDDRTRICLRRIVEKKYYRTNLVLTKDDEAMLQVLEKRKISAIAVLKWFYVLKNSPQFILLAQQNKIAPDEVFEKSMNCLREELRGEQNANCNANN